jgi:predicted small integral membrane protein
MGLSWMAWTWPTAAFFIVVALSIVAMGVWEHFSPGSGPRHGVLGLDTTRGDRLFISWLGTGFINLGWLFFYGAPLWGGLALSIVWFVLVFRYV